MNLLNDRDNSFVIENSLNHSQIAAKKKVILIINLKGAYQIKISKKFSTVHVRVS